ncbi:hypothetical protein RJ640_017325 [Escallonia rubra]|uniref:Uncharacterized protein n=1 Tax=Escallonia rubra TaxID=112253 RepID=A0AA88U721_9ASTE|nr:hypothetical protein RJ640_017325 [Escallonia rubra]
MDFSISWGDIRKKIGSLCVEVDEIMRQDSVKYVENQLLTAGANAKQLYSEFVQDVLPPVLVDLMAEKAPDLSLEANKDTDLTKKEKLNVGIDGELKKELCNVNSLLPECAEAVDESSISSSSKQNAGTGMNEEANKGVQENPTEKKVSSSEISGVLAPAEQDLGVAICCEANQSNNEEGFDGQFNMSIPNLLECMECNSTVTVGETSNLVGSGADTSSDTLVAKNMECNSTVKVGETSNLVGNGADTSSSVIFAKASEPKVQDSEAISSALTGTETSAGVIVSTIERSWSGFEPCDEYAEPLRFLFQADSGGSGDASGEGETCILVDDSKSGSISDVSTEFPPDEEHVSETLASEMKFGDEQKCDPQATSSKHQHTVLNQPRGQIFMQPLPTGELEPPDQYFSDSDWEMV